MLWTCLTVTGLIAIAAVFLWLTNFWANYMTEVGKKNL